MCVCYESFFFIHTFFSSAISTSILCYFKNTFHEFKALKKVNTTKRFKVDFI